MNIPLCGGKPRKPSWPRGAKCLVGDNGVDPILGPPFPPVNYELIVNPTNQPRLTWTVPELIIRADIEVHTLITNIFTCDILNYEWPEFNAGTAYITNSRVKRFDIRYYAKRASTGKDPALFPDDWAPDPTEFELWHFDPAVGQYAKVGDSAGGAYTATWSWSTLRFRFVYGTLADDSTHVFYVLARVPGQTVASQEFAVTLPTTISAPGAGDWSVVTSVTEAEAVDFSRLSSFPAGSDGMMFQFRINGSGDPLEWDGNIYDAAAWTVTMDFGETLYDFEIAWTNGPARVSPFSAVKTATTSAA